MGGKVQTCHTGPIAGLDAPEGGLSSVLAMPMQTAHSHSTEWLPPARREACVAIPSLLR